MPSNIEKLCEEINAMIEEDPQFFTAAISTKPGEQRLYLDFLMEDLVTGYIDFEKILPYDAAGAPGSTDDVYVGASLHITVHRYEGQRDGEYEHYSKIYPLCVYFDLNDAARAGKISSKILAEWPITREQRQERARNYRSSVKQYKEDVDRFINEQDPATHKALKEANAQARAGLKKKKQARRKKPPKK